ncbi:MAG: DUF1440 domain-containing protein [Edaphobacter sp.]
MRSNNPSILRGIITGMAAGIAATLIMDQFLKLSTAGQKAVEKRKELPESEDSTEIVARRIAEAAGMHLSKEQKKKAGRAVHYTFGTLMGVVYAVSAELLPEATTGVGTGYGTLLFLAADEVAVPALDLASSPPDTPGFDHLQHWAAHVVYGGSLEAVRSLMRRFL